jgi:hypothetical protein
LLSSRIIAFWHGCLAALFVNDGPYVIICPQLIHLYLALDLVHVMVIDERMSIWVHCQMKTLLIWFPLFHSSC